MGYMAETAEIKEQKTFDVLYSTESEENCQVFIIYDKIKKEKFSVTFTP